MVSLMAAPAGAQSLGEVSRQEEARRVTTKKAVKTLTNSDLGPDAITQSAGAAPAEASCYMSKSLGRCVGVEELVAKSVAGVQTAQNAPFELTYRAVQAGFTVAEVPITFRERRVGRSKMTARIALEAVWKVPALRLRR